MLSVRQKHVLDTRSSSTEAQFPRHRNSLFSLYSTSLLCLQQQAATTYTRSEPAITPLLFYLPAGALPPSLLLLPCPYFKNLISQLCEEEKEEDERELERPRQREKEESWSCEMMQFLFFHPSPPSVLVVSPFFLERVREEELKVVSDSLLPLPSPTSPRGHSFSPLSLFFSFFLLSLFHQGEDGLRRSHRRRGRDDEQGRLLLFLFSYVPFFLLSPSLVVGSVCAICDVVGGRRRRRLGRGGRGRVSGCGGEGRLEGLQRRSRGNEI